MSDFKKIKAILFDSGYTLNYPRTGNWFITPKFYEYVSRNSIDATLLMKAIRSSNIFLNNNHNIKTENEELQQFKEFYSIVLNECHYPRSTDAVIEGLAQDCVYNDNKYIFFDDVEQSLIHLKNKFELGVVSDTWPSLERVFKNKGLRDYFSTFVMSSVFGITKASEKLFKIALEELNHSPEEAIFVDDSHKNLIVASKLGMVPFQILRYSSKKANLYKLYSKLAFFLKTGKILHQISSLLELEHML
jgi:putative hydrolase of the HAD superfamily